LLPEAEKVTKEKCAGIGRVPTYSASQSKIGLEFSDEDRRRFEVDFLPA
jgi:hypothetical protein